MGISITQSHDTSPGSYGESMKPELLAHSIERTKKKSKFSYVALICFIPALYVAAHLLHAFYIEFGGHRMIQSAAAISSIYIFWFLTVSEKK